MSDLVQDEYEFRQRQKALRDASRWQDIKQREEELADLRSRLASAEQERDEWHRKYNDFFTNFKVLFDDRTKLRQDNAELAEKIVENRDALKNANELLRSAYQIAVRLGRETNWDAFIGRLEEALKRQAAVLEKQEQKP